MKLWTSRLLRLGLLIVFMLATFASPAMAKKGDEKLPPYDVDGISHGKIWVQWVFAFLFVSSCMAIAFKNPHRSSIERT